MATIPKGIRRTSYTLSTETAGPFLVGFRLFADADLRVRVDNTETDAFTVTSDYALGYDDNASITFDAAQPNGATVVIDGLVDIDREADLVSGNPNLVSKLNREQARVVAAAQESLRDAAEANAFALAVLDAIDGIGDIGDIILGDYTRRAIAESISAQWTFAAGLQATGGTVDLSAASLVGALKIYPVSASADLNSLPGDGLHPLNTGVTNTPDDALVSVGDYVIQITGNVLTVAQAFFDVTSQCFHFRKKAAGVWSAWAKGVTGLDIVGLSDLDFANSFPSQLPNRQGVAGFVAQELAWTTFSGVTIPAGYAIVTQAHGLGSTPRQVDVVLRCVTANNGYAVGDIVPIAGARASEFDGSASPAVAYDGTNVLVTYTSIFLLSRSGSTHFQVDTGSNWVFDIRVA